MANKIDDELDLYTEANRQLLEIRTGLRCNLSRKARRRQAIGILQVICILICGAVAGFALGVIIGPQITHFVSCQGTYNTTSNLVSLVCGSKVI